MQSKILDSLCEAQIKDQYFLRKEDFVALSFLHELYEI